MQETSSPAPRSVPRGEGWTGAPSPSPDLSAPEPKERRDVEQHAELSARMCPPGWSPGRTAAFLKGLVASEPGVLAGCLALVQWDESEMGWLRQQGLAAYTYYRIRAEKLLAQVPEAAQAALRLAYYGAVAQHILLSVEMDALLAEFRKLDIEPIVLKGMALSTSLYPSPATRPTSDLDILIRLPQVEVVRQALAARGYRDMGLGQGQHVAFAHHLHVWRESKGGHHIAVEAHWELVHDPGYASRMVVAEFFSRARRMDARGDAPLALDPADQLIHACAHLLLHHAQEFSLLWLLDLRLLVARYGQSWDWPELVERAARFRLAGALRYWLELTEAWYGPFLPPQAVKVLATARVALEEQWYIATASAGSARQWEFVWKRAWDVGDARQTLTFLGETFFPPWAYMQYRYGARSRWLAPLYYGWRFIRAGWVAFKRVGSG